jgi:hypothetical protein
VLHTPVPAFVCLAIGYCSLSWSQASVSSLRGTITDPSGFSSQSKQADLPVNRPVTLVTKSGTN